MTMCFAVIAKICSMRAARTGLLEACKVPASAPLYDLIVSGPQAFAEDDWAVYLGAFNPKLDVNKLIRFAMGIYWKASVYSWRKNVDETIIKLGPSSEKVRQFLLGGPFPEHMALSPLVSPPDRAYIGFNEPYESVRDGAGRCFILSVPGIWFVLSVGKTITSEVRDFSITTPASPIMISASLAAKGQDTALAVIRGARKSKAFLKSMEKVNAAKASKKV